MVYRTMQGREIDLEKLVSQNELMPAIGNMKVNARGDELGPGGQIIRKREEVVAEYYDTNPNAMPRAKAVPDVVNEVAPTEQVPAAPTKSKKTTTDTTEE